MGCVFGRFTSNNLGEDQVRKATPTPLSRRSEAEERTLVAVDPKDCVLDGIEGQVVFKSPGEIRGADFIVQNCKDAKVYLLDHTAAVMVDDCFDSHLFIGPCSGSVFLRDCSSCVLMVSCQQFRARDCKDCVVYLHCNTQPIIESCCRMSFGCFQFSYPQLKDQIHSAGLSLFNNHWMSVHDFTPEGSDNWKAIEEGDSTPCLVFASEADGELKKVGVSLHQADSVVPVTVGRRERTDGIESCLIIFFNNSNMTERAISFLSNVHGKVRIIATWEKNMTSTMLSNFFNKHPSPPSSFASGCTIFIEAQGSSCISLCNTLLEEGSGKLQSVYVSPSPQQAIADMDYFTRNLFEREFTM